MLTSARRGISYPNPDRSDRPDPAVHIGNLIPALEADAVYQQGTDAARIAAAHYPGGGRFWWATDTGILWYDDGVNWNNLSAAAVIPVGGSIEWDYAAASIPAYSQLQYGQAISRTTFAALNALANAAGYPHGAGDGSTTFNIADKRGRVSAGKDDMGGVAANRITAAVSGFNGTTLGVAGGAEGVTLSSVTIPSHNHPIVGGPGLSDGTHAHSYQGAQGNVSLTGNPYPGGNFTSNTGFSTSNISISAGSLTTSSVGSGGAHLNTQPTIIVNKIIRVL